MVRPAVAFMKVGRSSAGFVGLGMSNNLGRDIATGTAPVLNNNCLLQSLTQALADQPRKGVGYTAGREGNNKSDLSARVLLRASLLARALKNEQRKRHNCGGSA